MAAQTEGHPIDDGVNLTSLSMVTQAESALSHKFVPLEVSETADFKESPRKVGMLLGQGGSGHSYSLWLGFVGW
jgi:hypothetical protein